MGGGLVEREEWTLVKSTCATPGAEGIPVYGVAVRRRDGGRWSWADVDTDPAVVRRLVARLQAAQPERCHYEELVLDFIQETADAGR